jgi:hypothetical protein
VLLIVLVPLVVAASVLLFEVRDDSFPLADRALMELKTRDVGRHEVLTGLYSRDGWSHPGPAAFYVLAIPYRLVGERAIGLPLGALLVNGGALAGMVVLARRRGGTSLMLLTAAGCVLVMRSLGAEFLRDAWVPYLAVLPFGLLVFLVWEASCGWVWALPVAAALASILVQTHIGYATVALPLVAWAGGWLLVGTIRTARTADRARRRSQWRALGIGVAVATGVTLLVWLPAIIEELGNSPGNLSKTAEWFGDAREGVHGVAEGFRLVGSQFELLPTWVTGDFDYVGVAGEPAALYETPVPVFLLPFALATAVLVRLRRNEAARLAWTLWFALALGVLSVQRTVGLAYEYRMRWLWITAMLVSVVTVWALWLLVAPRWSPRLHRRLVPVALVGLGIVGAANVVAAARAGTPDHLPTSPDLGPLVTRLRRALPPGPGDVVFARTTSPGSEYYLQGLVSELERAGIPARVAEDRADRYGHHRVHDPGARTRVRLTVADQAALLDELGRPGARLLAYVGPPPDVLARRLARLDELQAEYRRGRLTFTEVLEARAAIDVQTIGVLVDPSLRNPSGTSQDSGPD